MHGIRLWISQAWLTGLGTLNGTSDNVDEEAMSRHTGISVFLMAATERRNSCSHVERLTRDKTTKKSVQRTSNSSNLKTLKLSIFQHSVILDFSQVWP